MADSRVPVTVLTGFLGSGKTTLLNHILRSPDHGLRFAIIENEFGAVGVDEHLIAGKTEASEEVVEVMNGCICCTVRGDLVEALKRMHTRVAEFDAVLIETTGMADPAPVAQTFFVDKDIGAKYRLDGIVTVVDAAHVEQHLDEKKPEGAENESVEQLAFADRIILNKCDLVGASVTTKVDDGGRCRKAPRIATNSDQDETGPSEASREEALRKLESRVRAINPQAPIIRASFSKVDPKLLLQLNAFDLERVLEMDPAFLDQDPSAHVHDDTISSVSWSFPGLELNVSKLEKWIGSLMRELGADLFRYKGVLAVKGCDEKYVFQGVHMLFNGGFASDVLGGLGQTPEDHGLIKWQPDEERQCRFVFIGRNIKQKHGDRLKAEFLECGAEATLRFKVGDVVRALGPTGHWWPAKVTKVWDKGHPYRLEICDQGVEVWGPWDDDRVVTAQEV